MSKHRGKVGCYNFMLCSWAELAALPFCIDMYLLYTPIIIYWFLFTI